MSVSRRTFAAGLGSLPLWQAKPETAPKPPPTSNPEPPPVPHLFDPHELATVAALAEIIIPATDTPGAREAHVAEYLDLILSDSPDSVRTAFLEGLWWIDGYCQRSVGAPFKDLPPSDQLRVLETLQASESNNEATGHAFVRSIKAWTGRIYYSTDVGYRELNKGDRVPSTYARSCQS